MKFVTEVWKVIFDLHDVLYVDLEHLGIWMTALSISLIVDDFTFAFIEFEFLQHYLRGMGGETLEMSAFLPGLVKFLLLPILFLRFFGLNYVKTHYLKDLLSL